MVFDLDGEQIDSAPSKPSTWWSGSSSGTASAPETPTAGIWATGSDSVISSRLNLSMPSERMYRPMPVSWRRRRTSVAVDRGRRLSALAGFYGYALDMEVVSRNPLSPVKRPKVGTDMSTGLDRDELGALISAARSDGPRSNALVLLLGLNGLRVSEALEADVTDLSTERGHRVLRVTRKGGGVQRSPWHRGPPMQSRGWSTRGKKVPYLSPPRDPAWIGWLHGDWSAN